MNEKNPLVAVLSAAAILVGCAANPPAKPEQLARGDYETGKRYVSEFIQYQMKKHDVPGLSIALVDDQEIVWAAGFGYADKAKSVRAAPETVYRVGSISKLFTATAAMQLAEQNKLDIDKPLQTFVPEFSIKRRFDGAAAITPRTILTHHSGLPDNFLHGMWAAAPAPFTVVAGQLRDEYTAFPPDYIFSYSNLGFTLLGHAIQSAAGEDFSAYLERALLRPLNMTRSALSTRADTPGMAKGYRDGKEAQDWPLRDVPAGGLNSTVVDLARFLKMVFADGRSNGHQVLKSETLAQMLHAQNSQVLLDQDFRIGLGWILSGLGTINIENGGPIAYHGGATLLYRSQLMALPAHKLGVVVLANSPSAGSVVNDVATETLKLALEAKAGIKQPERRKPETTTDPLPADVLRAFTGQYATAFGFTTITNDGRHLRATFGGKNFDLVPGADGTLSMRYKLLGLFPLELEKLKDIGLVRATLAGHELLLAQSHGNRMLVGEKITPVPIADAWMARVGDYQIVNGAGDAVAALVKGVRLRYRDGFLLVEITLTEGTSTLPLMSLTDHEAIFLGLGRGAQETIRAVIVDGAERLAYSGYVLEKTR